MVQNTTPSLDVLYKEIRVAEENYNQLVATAELIAQAVAGNLEVFQRCLPTYPGNDFNFYQMSSDGDNSLYAQLYARDILGVYSKKSFSAAKLQFRHEDSVFRLNYLYKEEWLRHFIEKTYPFLVEQLGKHNEEQAEYFAKLRQLYAEA